MRISMLGHKRIPSREGGIEIVVEELSTRMVKLGHSVTVYNRNGKHVSGGRVEKTDEYNHYQAILRCQREYVDEVRASLAIIYKHNRKDISVSTIGLSGTIKACQKFIEK